jgi:hypothetical protein
MLKDTPLKTDIVQGTELIETTDVTIPAGHVLLQDGDKVFFTSTRMYNKWYKGKFTLLGMATNTDIRHTLTNQTKTTYENLTRNSAKIIGRIGRGCGTCGGK